MTMRLTRRKHLWRYCSRCLLTGLAIVAYLTSTIGFPLPVSRAREQSLSSDCQGRQCGCPESERSQQKCCCFPHGHKVDSTAVQEKSEIACSSCERWVARPESSKGVPWASRPSKTQGVPPKSLTPARGESGSKECPSCSQQPISRPGAHPNGKDQAEKGDCPSSSKGQSPFSAWVLGVSALRCHGLSTLWIAAGAVLPPPPALTWSPSWPLTGWLGYHDAESNFRVKSPPDRPPRSAHL